MKNKGLLPGVFRMIYYVLSQCGTYFVTLVRSLQEANHILVGLLLKLDANIEKVFFLSHLFLLGESGIITSTLYYYIRHCHYTQCLIGIIAERIPMTIPLLSSFP